jgi:hypothetical protein
MGKIRKKRRTTFHWGVFFRKFRHSECDSTIPNAAKRLGFQENTGFFARLLATLAMAG